MSRKSNKSIVILYSYPYIVRMKGACYSWLLTVVMTFVGFTSASGQFRTAEKVEQQIAFTWTVVDMVVKPGEPFYGTKEEKAFMDEVWQETVKSIMGTNVFTFFSNKSYVIKVQKSDGKYKVHKGKWRIEKAGDILVMTERNKKEDEIKILLIDDEELELLFNYDNGFLLVFKKVADQ